MMHVYGDPLKYRDLEDRIAVEKFNSAIILCDAAWVDPDQVLDGDSCSLMTCANSSSRATSYDRCAKRRDVYSQCQ